MRAGSSQQRPGGRSELEGQRAEHPGKTQAQQGRQIWEEAVGRGGEGRGTWALEVQGTALEPDGLGWLLEPRDT